MLQTIKCLIGKHAFESQGRIGQDEIFVCTGCGQRRTEYYTLRIDRLGPPVAGQTGLAGEPPRPCCSQRPPR